MKRDNVLFLCLSIHRTTSELILEETDKQKKESLLKMQGELEEIIKEIKAAKGKSPKNIADFLKWYLRYRGIKDVLEQGGDLLL